MAVLEARREAVNGGAGVLLGVRAILYRKDRNSVFKASTNPTLQVHTIFSASVEI